jgi:single-strand DNA-binding protein
MNGEGRQERTEWQRVQVGPGCRARAAGFKKGAHIRVEGELRSREYQTDTGVKIRTYVIVASSIMNLRPGQRTAGSTPEPGARQRRSG